MKADPHPRLPPQSRGRSTVFGRSRRCGRGTGAEILLACGHQDDKVGECALALQGIPFLREYTEERNDKSLWPQRGRSKGVAFFMLLTHDDYFCGNFFTRIGKCLDFAGG
jgi:hypothetical protein